MTGYVWLRLAHVLAAVLGAGLVTALALLSRSTPFPTLRPLARLVGASFGVLLLTAVAMDVATGGALHHALWFRLAGVSLVVTGAIVGRLQRRLRTNDESQRAGVMRAAWIACALVGWMVTLMELRPFG